MYSFIFLTIDGIAGFLCSSGDIFQEGRKKGKYISFSDTASPHFMASNTNNILFRNGAIAIAEESHIQGEFSFYTHPITHTHIISAAEPHLMLIKIVSSKFFTTGRRCICGMYWACFGNCFYLKTGGWSKAFGEQGQQIFLSIFEGIMRSCQHSLLFPICFGANMGTPRD